MNSQMLDSTFHTLHDAGAERHPTRWWGVNQIAADAMAALGIRLDDKQARTLATLVALRMLDKFRPLGTPEEPNAEENIARLVRSAPRVS